MCLMKDQWVECGNGEKITKQEFPIGFRMEDII